MHIYFRTDGNEIIATGHVMRCLSIADACRAQGDRITFITADNSCSELIQQRGHENIVINKKWDKLEYELDKLERLIIEESIQLLVIDSYYVTEYYLKTLRKLTKIVYIDDLNAFHYPVDVLINYSVYADRFRYPSRYPNAKLLLGCEYVPLRKQFENVIKRNVSNNVQNILITTGGTDIPNLAGKLLNRMMGDREFEEINIHVLTGAFNSNIEELCELEEKFDRATIHCNVEDVAALMVEADVAISAGGSTLYELSACGTPTITYSFADNQLDNVKSFAERDLMEYAGDTRHGIESCIENIVSIIRKYMQSKEKRENASQRLQKLVDGLGSERVAKAIKL